MEHSDIQIGNKYYTTKELESEIIIPAKSKVIVEKKARDGDVNIQVKVIKSDFSFWMNSKDLTNSKTLENTPSKKEF